MEDLGQQIARLREEIASLENLRRVLGEQVVEQKGAELREELEWERAARGTDGREYPWGETFAPERANTSESGLEGATAVCAFPQGASPCGAWDMGGNVWEWTDSWWDEARDRRVVRGGSWINLDRFARCAYRGRGFPGYYYDNLGFRVVASLAGSES
jgi:serine/threonine-protein kinase